MSQILDQLDDQISKIMANEQLSIVGSEIYQPSESEGPGYVLLLLNEPKQFPVDFPKLFHVTDDQGAPVAVPIRYQLISPFVTTS